MPLSVRSAGTLRFAGAPRPGLLPPTAQKAQINPGLSSQLDEKRGSRQLEPPTAVILGLRQRPDAALFAMPFEAAIVRDIAFAVGPDRGAVWAAAGCRDDARRSVRRNARQRAGGDLDQQHRSVGERDRPFRKLQPLGKRAEFHCVSSLLRVCHSRAAVGWAERSEAHYRQRWAPRLLSPSYEDGARDR